MGIRKKILGFMSFIMLIFISTILIINSNAKKLDKLAHVSTISYSLSNSYTKISETSLRFRMIKNPLKTHLKNIRSSRDNFEVILQEFNNLEGKILLDPKLQKRWESINKLWELSSVHIAETVKHLENLQGSSIETMFNLSPFSLIISKLPEIAKNPKYLKVYPDIRDLDLSISSIISTTQVLDKSLADTREAITIELENKTSKNVLFTLISITLSVIISLIVSLLFSQNISHKINMIKHILKKISLKDLSVEININSNDEFQELGDYIRELVTTFNEFIHSAGQTVSKATEIKNALSDGTQHSGHLLDKINNKIKHMSDQFSNLDKDIESSTTEIITLDSEIKKILSHVNEQSNAVSISSSSIEEMTKSVSQIALLTRQKQDSTKNLMNIVLKGGESVENTQDNIRLVSEELNNIKDLVEVIKNIADQTNILSMNAAIESAHAGESGKGFSVVADEIRSLAEYTSNNVNNIHSAIGSISKKIDSSLSASKDSSNVFEQINIDVNEFSLAMLEISDSINKLSIGSNEVLNSTIKVSNLNHNVFEGTEKIKHQSLKIENSMLSVKSISNGVNTDFNDISKGSFAVLESFSGMNDISEQNSDKIEVLSKRMREFNLC